MERAQELLHKIHKNIGFNGSTYSWVCAMIPRVYSNRENIYLFRVNNENTIKNCKVYSK